MADKTGRLFAIIDNLRRRRRPVSAEVLAGEQGGPVRTLYRDIQPLVALGAPLEGARAPGCGVRGGGDGVIAENGGRPVRICDKLGRRRRAVRAGVLAGEQGVAVRTLMRDIQALVALGAPIEGAAGVGYILRAGFFLPPLMFTAEELEALVLGARWVEGRQDGALSLAAGMALAKIAAASPDELKQRIDEAGRSEEHTSELQSLMRKS